jgi:hypothetical protein
MVHPGKIMGKSGEREVKTKEGIQKEENETKIKIKFSVFSIGLYASRNEVKE